MTRKQALAILGLTEAAEAEAVKHAYRKLAFDLHPDLHPENPNAGKDFQRLNEAYVLLTTPEPPRAQRAAWGRRGAAGQTAEATEKARAEAQQAYARARKRFDEEQAGGGAGTARESAAQGAGTEKTREMKRDDVLRDLLRDPFARRVFEDIYSQIREESARKQAAADRARGTPGGSSRMRKAEPEPGFLGKTADNVSDWLRRQIDEEQTVRFAGALTPGKRVRLQIHHGVFGKSQTIELTLPPEFEPGRPIRLKGLGKRIGKWHGDLYLRIVNQ